MDGWFQKWFPVTGGEFYRFAAIRKLTDVAVPRRSASSASVGRMTVAPMVSADVPKQQAEELGQVPSAEPEHPTDGATDSQGWTTVSGIYRAPSKATRAIVELHLQWGTAREGRMERCRNFPKLQHTPNSAPGDSPI